MRIFLSVIRYPYPSGTLVRILRKYEGEAIPASIVYPSARHQSPNASAFVRFAQSRLRERLQKLQGKNCV